jgi:hypothetical protein
LKRPWDDGTTAIVISGQELLARLSALVPPPRIHTVRYYGVWAPRSAWRSLVLPEGANEDNGKAGARRNADGGGNTASACGSHHRYRLSWAQAIAKVFEVDVTSCPRCKQKGMQQIRCHHRHSRAGRDGCEDRPQGRATPGATRRRASPDGAGRSSSSESRCFHPPR